MPDVMKTLLLNPPSFENFDGGASSRWPATREIESYWYPVWLTYPAGMIPGSRLLDASPAKVNWQQTVQICKDYEFLVLFTSTVGFASDVKLIRKIKEANPGLKIAFVGPHGHIKPDETLMTSEDIDFVTRGEFDHSVVEYAHGKPLDQILGISYREDGRIIHNASRPQLHTEELDALPFATDIYKRDLDIERYNVPFLLHPFVSFYTTRGCPALCTFCMWPQTISGHAWRTRSTENVAREVKQCIEYFPQMKEIFFDDDTFNIRKDRVLDLCTKFKPLKFRWSSTSRVHSDYETLKAMADSGARLFIVGFESGDAQILKNIKKGATVEMARQFVKNCKKVGIRVHGDFIIGLPGETKETIQKTIDFAKELDCETIQVSLAHAMPGTELHDSMAKQPSHLQEALLGQGVVQFRARHGVRQRNLDRLAIQLLRKIDGLLNRFPRFAWQADDEVAVHANANLAAVLHERARHLHRGALLDILQNLRIAGLEAHDKEPCARIRHAPQRFIITMHARRGRPAEFQRLELAAQIQYAVLANIKSIVVEENFLHLRKIFDRLFYFARHVLRRARAPRMPRNGLRPHAEGAQRRATASRIERHERMQQKWHVIVLDLQVALVNVRGKRQRVQLFRVQLRPLRAVYDLAVLAIADTQNLAQRFAVRVFDHRMVELPARHEIDVLAGTQRLVGPDVSVRTNEGNLEAWIRFLDLADQLDVARKPYRRRKQHQEFIVLADLHRLLPIDLGR